MEYDAARALELLRSGTSQPAAAFREGQDAAIQYIVEGRGRLLLVQKTGWGKSFVYFIATKLLREAGEGPALLISPLLALMRNQIAAAERMGVRAARITSDNREDWEDVEERLECDAVDILLVTPERFANQRHREAVLASVSGRVSLLVIDEAHCISDWGHDFRPRYRQIGRFAKNLPPNTRLLATTATANNRVMHDLRAVLGAGLEVSRGELDRSSLFLQTIQLRRQSERLAWLAEHVPTMPGHGIIYTLTVRDARQVAAWLRSRGLEVEAYTADSSDREALELALVENRVKALVATVALGMGFDKPDLGFVIHYQSPSSVVAYYQQVGRAGRALETAYGVLLSGEEETDIADYFIRSAFPTRDEVRRVIRALDAEPKGLSLAELQGRVNVNKKRIDHAVLLLSLESPAPIVEERRKWQLTAESLSEEFWQRAERLTTLRRDEQRQMQEYVRLETGHMEFLIRALDGEPGAALPLDLPRLATATAPQLVREAVAFLRRTNLPIAPRSTWPAGGLREYSVRGKISADCRPELGKALCVWGDSGWGELVRRGKYEDGQFTVELVEACADMVTRWEPEPAPGWVTCIPSRRRPNLVPDFAERLAARLGLPFVQVMEKVRDTTEQKSMENSAHQARNLDGAFKMTHDPHPDPVLLVDDMVDSRWTMTVAGWLLRSRGSGPVLPLALALSSRG